MYLLIGFRSKNKEVCYLEDNPWSQLTNLLGEFRKEYLYY
jgi:hypothetical protein